MEAGRHPAIFPGPLRTALSSAGSGGGGEYRRAELRSPDPLCNPYLAFVLLIRAGMEGVAHNMQLPPAADLNLYTAPEEIRARYRRLPETWAEAKAAAAASGFIKEHLPAAIIQYYT